jgi:5-methylthioribose kinase
MGIELMRLIEVFLASYFEIVAPHLPGAARRDFELRLHRNLAACLLARVDGKSPVNYLDERQQQRVRRYAVACLTHDPVPLSLLTTHLHHQMTGISL